MKIKETISIIKFCISHSKEIGKLMSIFIKYGLTNINEWMNLHDHYKGDIIKFKKAKALIVNSKIKKLKSIKCDFMFVESGIPLHVGKLSVGCKISCQKIN